MRILFIRHAQTLDNVSGALSTAVPGPSLSDLGRRQADAVADTLAEEPIEAVYASTARRSQQTAEPLARARGLTVEVIDGVQEISAGDLEDRSDEDALRAYVGTIYSWTTDPSTRIPGGEDGTGFVRRFGTAVATIAARQSGTVAVVSHGAALRTWISSSTRNLTPDFGHEHGLDNSAVVIVEGSSDTGWTVVTWGDEPVGGPALADTAAADPTGGPGAGSGS